MEDGIDTLKKIYKRILNNILNFNAQNQEFFFFFFFWGEKLRVKTLVISLY